MAEDNERSIDRQKLQDKGWPKSGTARGRELNDVPTKSYQESVERNASPGPNTT